MGSLLSYSGVVTKIRAMEKHLISDDEFREIVSLPSVPAIEAYLMKNPRYAEEFRGFPAEEIHRGVLESILGCTVFRDYVKIFHFCSTEQRKFLRKYVRRYEIRLLKKCLSFVCQGNTPKDSMFAYGDFFDRYTSLDTKSLSACTSIADLLHAIRDTEYAPVLGRISETPDPQLFDYATALDMYHFRTGWKDLAKIVPKDSLEAVTAGYGTKMDMLNLWYIHRARVWYQLSEAETYRIILPVHYRLRKEEIAALIAADTEEKFAQELAKTKYGRNYAELRPDNLEEMYVFIMQKILRAEARKHPYSVATLFDYLYRKEHQDYRVTTVIECIRYGIHGEETKKMIAAL